MTVATETRAEVRPVTADDPPPEVVRPSGWAALKGRLPGDELAGIATLLALAALVVAVLLGWAAPTTAVSLAVLVLGARLVIDARSGELPTGVAVTAGVLTVVLSACWWSGVDLDHQPRWTTERPTEGLAAYQQAAGSLTIDLTDPDVPRPVGVTAEMGVGRVVVKVADADVRAGLVDVQAKVAGGWASVPIPRPDDRVRPIGRDAGPALMDEVATRPGATPTITVRVAVAVGQVSVQRVR